MDAAGARGVVIVEGDLLDQEVDVLVDPWNRNVLPWWLLLPQGVAGAMLRRAGREPFAALWKAGPMLLGTAVLTPPGRLRQRAIVHVAGIDLLWRASERSIRDSAANALALAETNGFSSIAFPLIGAGTGSLGAGEAERILLGELESRDTPLEVRLVRYRAD